jgi:hypothetical protein
VQGQVEAGGAGELQIDAPACFHGDGAMMRIARSEVVPRAVELLFQGIAVLCRIDRTQQRRTAASLG